MAGCQWRCANFAAPAPTGHVTWPWANRKRVGDAQRGAVACRAVGQAEIKTQWQEKRSKTHIKPFRHFCSSCQIAYCQLCDCLRAIFPWRVGAYSWQAQCVTVHKSIFLLVEIVWQSKMRWRLLKEPIVKVSWQCFRVAVSPGWQGNRPPRGGGDKLQQGEQLSKSVICLLSARYLSLHLNFLLQGVFFHWASP